MAHGQTTKLLGIQYLRGVAALMVVVYHVSEYLGITGLIEKSSVLHIGSKGVDLFFVISGFVIAYVHSRELGQPSASPKYWAKRLSRIYPPYWCVLIPLVLAGFLLPSAFAADDRQPLRILASLLLWPEAQFPILNVAWSLSYEMLFYVLFGLGILKKWLGVCVGMLLLAGVIAAASFTSVPFPLRFIFSPYHFQFALGIAVALIHARTEWRTVRKSLMLAGIVGLLIAGGAMLSEDFFDKMFWGGISSFCVLGAINAPAAGGTLRWGISSVGEYFGNASYSIYLVHNPAISLLGSVASALSVKNAISVGVLTFIGAVGVALLFYSLVEKPLMVRFSRRLRKQVAPAVA